MKTGQLIRLARNTWISQELYSSTPSDIESFFNTWVKKGTSMILCFYWQEVESFKEKHKIIGVTLPPLQSRPLYRPNKR
jgi:hypothetical protein